MGTTWWGILIGVALLGAVDSTLVGSATGILNTGAQLGTAVGTAIVVLVASTAGAPAGWALAAAVALIAGLWCILRKSNPGASGRSPNGSHAAA